MRQGWSGSPRGRSRLNVLKQNARGMGTTHAALKGSNCNAMLNVRGRNVTSAGRRTARRVSTRCRATRYARCGACSANRGHPRTSHDRAGRADDAQSLPCTIRSDRGPRQNDVSIHPHMLRHGCGYALANAGHDTRALQAWLGHKNIQHTVRYTELAPDRFKDFWR